MFPPWKLPTLQASRREPHHRRVFLIALEKDVNVAAEVARSSLGSLGTGHAPGAVCVADGGYSGSCHSGWCCSSRSSSRVCTSRSARQPSPRWCSAGSFLAVASGPLRWDERREGVAGKNRRANRRWPSGSLKRGMSSIGRGLRMDAASHIRRHAKCPTAFDLERQFNLLETTSD